MAACVLVVEDERKIRDLLRDYLEHDGLDVVTTGSGAEAIKLARDAAPDLIVLDLRLPDVPGEEVAREVRTSSPVPIMMLTATTAAEDRIHGLEPGADDYVTKPFSPREVLLRARAILRRAAGTPEPDAPASYGGSTLVIDEARRQVTAAGRPVTLTTTEWKLLAALASVPGRVYSRYELVNRARGYEYDGYERTIDSHIRNLRHKIEPDPPPGPHRDRHRRRLPARRPPRPPAGHRLTRRGDGGQVVAHDDDVGGVQGQVGADPAHGGAGGCGGQGGGVVDAVPGEQVPPSRGSQAGCQAG